VGEALQAEATDHTGIAEEDALRAHTYGLLARLLAEPPTPEMMDVVRGLEGDETPFGQALGTLSAAARKISVEAAGDEYFELFVGAGQSELLPYGSYYITGFLNEWPAANLVGDMRKLGIARADHVSEPEDHIAALCEMMAGLITGDLGAQAGIAAELDAQREFFDAHIGNWAPKFFEDLEASKTAAFYMPVGTIGKLFMEIEAEGFRMTA
jgi:TorA maturation chaperone TorD